MKKIAIALGRVYPGGTTEVARILGGELAKRGYQVDYWLLDEKAPGKKSIEETGLPVYHVTQKKLGMKWSHFIEKIGEDLSKYDILILNGSFAKVAFAALELLPDKTQVISLHHYIEADRLEPIVMNSERWNVAIGVSPLASLSLKNRFQDKRPVLTIPLGVSIPENEASQINEREKESVFRISYVGRLKDSGKGIFLLPTILEKLKKENIAFHMDIMGDGKDKEKLEQKFHSKYLLTQVTFWGHVSHEKVYENLKKSHCLLLVSPSESFGLALVEAQFCGCVPVATKVIGSTDQIIEEGVTGSLCDDRGPESYAEKLIFWAKDRDKWAQASLEAQKQSRKKYSMEAMVDAYEKLFDDIEKGKYPLPRKRLATAEEIQNRWSRWKSFLAWPASFGFKRIVNYIKLSYEEIKYK